jgi:hypothetical protein
MCFMGDKLVITVDSNIKVYDIPPTEKQVAPEKKALFTAKNDHWILVF